MTTDAMEAANNKLYSLLDRHGVRFEGPSPFIAEEAAELVVQAFLTATTPDLEGIRERASGIVLASNLKNTDAWRLINTDIPTLIAEVASLRVRVGELEGALKDIAGSGPVDKNGNQDAYAGWDWCYERARWALLPKEMRDGFDALTDMLADADPDVVKQAFTKESSDD